MARVRLRNFLPPTGWNSFHLLFTESNELDLVPLPETPAKTLEYEDYQNSSLISLRNFEAYLERAKKEDLFNEQHDVSNAENIISILN